MKRKFKLPKPSINSIIYNDKKLYACLANHPISRGHTIIVWKKPVRDIHFLSKKDYDYLSDKIDELRNALLKALKIKKVYLLYMDEANQVHWHLIPRYKQKGFDIFKNKPSQLKDYSLAKHIRSNLVLKI